MNEDIEKNKDNNIELSISKSYFFISKNTDVSKKDNENIKKKNIKFVIFKKPFFKTKNISGLNKKNTINPNINDGRWTEEEKNKFIQGIVLYGHNWKKVNKLIPSRTAVQVRSHAQKFFYKMRSCKDDSLGINFALNPVKNIRDMINQIKCSNPNSNIIFILKKLSNKYVNKRKYKLFQKKTKNIQCDGDNCGNNKNNGSNISSKSKEENNNYINNILNVNDHNIKLFEKYDVNNKFNQPIYNNVNNNLSFNNNISIENINFGKYIINNNFYFPPSLLNNSLLLNRQNNLYPNNNLDYTNFNNNLLNMYLKSNLENNLFNNSLSENNKSLFPGNINLESMNLIDSNCISNKLYALNFLNNFPLINNINLQNIRNNYSNNNNTLKQINGTDEENNNN